MKTNRPIEHETPTDVPNRLSVVEYGKGSCDHLVVTSDIDRHHDRRIEGASRMQPHLVELN